MENTQCFLYVLARVEYHKKGRIDNLAELDPSSSKEYEVEAIWDSEMYAKESEGYLSLGLYYLVL